jgi:hypothetical protein
MGMKALGYRVAFTSLEWTRRFENKSKAG